MLLFEEIRASGSLDSVKAKYSSGALGGRDEVTVIYPGEICKSISMEALDTYTEMLKRYEEG